MSVSSGRIVCPRCGVNNFATQAACWKCGAPLSVGGAEPADDLRPARELRLPADARPVPAPPGAPLPVTSVDPAVALWAAFALAFFFPFVAVPAGLVFLMLDDRRKAQIGKLTLVLGLIFSLVHVIITGWMFREAVAQVGGLWSSSLRSRSAPRPGDPAPPLRLPGLNQ